MLTLFASQIQPMKLQQEPFDTDDLHQTKRLQFEVPSTIEGLLGHHQTRGHQTLLIQALMQLHPSIGLRGVEHRLQWLSIVHVKAMHLQMHREWTMLKPNLILNTLSNAVANLQPLHDGSLDRNPPKRRGSSYHQNRMLRHLLDVGDALVVAIRALR